MNAALYMCTQGSFTSSVNVLRDVVLACIILHNMIVEDEKERDILEENLDLNVPPSSSTVQKLEFSLNQNVPLERALQKDTSIRDRSAHRRLKNDFGVTYLK